MSPWTEARFHSTWSSTDSSVSPRRLRRPPLSPGVVQVRSVDRVEPIARGQADATQPAASRTAPGSLDTVIPRRPPSPEKPVEPPATMGYSQRSSGESSPANSRRERYGIATIMARGTQRQQPAVAAPQPTAATTQPMETTQPRAAADNSFDSVPTDISDTTSRSRSGEPVTTTSMDSSSSATGA